MQETATIHLGVDVFVPVGTAVHAPVDAVVTAIDATNGVLYLSIEAFGGLRLAGVSVLPAAKVVGTRVRAGIPVAVVDLSLPGPKSRVFPPHLHLQLCVGPDGANFPGLAFPSLKDAWLAMCPEPSAALLSLCLPHVTLTATGASMSALHSAPTADRSALALRRRSVAGVQEHYFVEPPNIERGWQQHLIDTSGRAYLDVVNNVAVLGHSHPHVRAATVRQLSRLNTNSRFVYAALGEFAAAIVARMPKGSGLDSILFVNSGSEATDLALRVARTATGRKDVLCMEGGYHGVTTASDEISTTLNDNPNSRDTRPPWIHLCPMPNLFRGRFPCSNSEDPRVVADTVDKYAGAVQAIIAKIQARGSTTAAGAPAASAGPACFIAEPLSGNAGGVEIPPGYLKKVYAAVRAAGGLCIADEVQVGYGRLGTHFWGFQEHDVVPDIVTMAKAAGNGHPLGFVVTTSKLAKAFAAEGSFFSSAGGGPVSCAVGSAVLEAIDKDRLQDNSRVVGAHLTRRFRELQKRYPHVIGCVHGHGLYQGLEIVTDASAARKPATAAASAICERLLELGVACHATGDYSNVLKCKPPMCITVRSADFFVDALDVVMRERAGVPPAPPAAAPQPKL